MYIYLFTNKTNGKKYVGQSSTKSGRRIKAHFYNARIEFIRRKSLLARAIYKYGWDNFERQIIEICSTADELNAAEILWIERHQSLSPKGYNLTLGGDGGGLHSDETRQKMSISAKQRSPPSEETRRKISESGKGRVKSPETRLKLSKAMTGVSRGPMSEEAKKVRSEAGMGRVFTEETRRKISEAQTGKPKSAEGIRKMALAKTGKKLPPRSEEHKRKISEAKIGGSHSEATKQKLSDAAKLQWEKKRSDAETRSL